MKLQETEIVVPAPDGEILATVISPVDGGPRPGVLLYTDIFQRTESTLRTARRLASAGFLLVCPTSTLAVTWPASRWNSTTRASNWGWRARRR